MLVRTLAGLAGVAALFAGAQAARADDVIRLKGTAGSTAPAITLGYDGNSDTELARYYGGGYRGGFHGGHYGGYRGGFYGGHVGHYGGYRGGFYGGRVGFYGGYRGYYGGYRGFYGGYAGFYRPYYGGYYGGYGGYYSPYYYSSYYSTPYYYSSPYYGGYYGAPYYDYGCSATPATYGAVTQLSVVQQPYYPSVTPYGSTSPYGSGLPYGNAAPYTVPQQGISGYGGAPQQQQQPMPPLPNATYPYDGGPNTPVPQPRQDAAPAKSAPPATTTLRLVNTTGQPAPRPAQFSFPAYGEDTRASGFAIDRTAPVRKTSR